MQTLSIIHHWITSTKQSHLTGVHSGFNRFSFFSEKSFHLNIDCTTIYIFHGNIYISKVFNCNASLHKHFTKYRYLGLGEEKT